MEERETMKNLVERAKKGDVEAFTALYNDTIDKAYYTAVKIVKNPQDAQDMVQDAYIKAFTTLDSLNNEERFDSWLNCIVANRCKDYLKKKKPDFFPKSDNDNDEDFIESIVGKDPGLLPEEVTESRETKRLVMQCIEKLPDDQRICLLMFYYDELTIKEIAQALDVSENTVKSRLNYARKKLRKEFEELEEDGIKLYALPFFPLIRIAFTQDNRNIDFPDIPLNQIIKKTAVRLFLKGKVIRAIKVTTFLYKTKNIFITVSVVAVVIALIVGTVNFFNHQPPKEKPVSVTVSQEIGKKPRKKKPLHINSDNFVVMTHDKRIIAYTKNDGVYLAKPDFTDETRIFGEKAQGLVFRNDVLYFTVKGNVYAYELKTKKCYIVNESAGIEKFYTLNNRVYGYGKNKVYSVDLKKGLFDEILSFNNDSHYYENGYFVSNENGVKKAYPLDNVNNVIECATVGKNQLDFKLQVESGCVYIPDENIDENGKIKIVSLSDKDKRSKDIVLCKGVIDFAVNENSIYYTVYDKGVYKKHLDDGKIYKISDRELYYICEYGGYTAWCNAENNSTVIIKDGERYVLSGIIRDFSIIGNKIFYEENDIIHFTTLHNLQEQD